MRRLIPHKILIISKTIMSSKSLTSAEEALHATVFRLSFLYWKNRDYERLEDGEKIFTFKPWKRVVASGLSSVMAG